MESEKWEGKRIERVRQIGRQTERDRQKNRDKDRDTERVRGKLLWGEMTCLQTWTD